VADSGQSAGRGLAAFGRHLVQERELRGLSREEVVRATRLPAGVVAALEDGDPERAQHRAYVVGYLRSYAAAVGLDPDETVLRFEEALGPTVEPPAPRAGRATVAVALMAAAAVALAAAFTWWSLRGR
jgi:cytoskeletal protein RodZ